MLGDGSGDVAVRRGRGGPASTSGSDGRQAEGRQAGSPARGLRGVGVASRRGAVAGRTVAGLRHRPDRRRGGNAIADARHRGHRDGPTRRQAAVLEGWEVAGLHHRRLRGGTREDGGDRKDGEDQGGGQIQARSAEPRQRRAGDHRRRGDRRVQRRRQVPGHAPVPDQGARERRHRYRRPRPRHGRRYQLRQRRQLRVQRSRNASGPGDRRRGESRQRHPGL